MRRTCPAGTPCAARRGGCPARSPAGRCHWQGCCPAASLQARGGAKHSSAMSRRKAGTHGDGRAVAQLLGTAEQVSFGSTLCHAACSSSPRLAGTLHPQRHTRRATHPRTPRAATGQRAATGRASGRPWAGRRGRSWTSCRRRGHAAGGPATTQPRGCAPQSRRRSRQPGAARRAALR